MGPQPAGLGQASSLSPAPASETVLKGTPSSFPHPELQPEAQTLCSLTGTEDGTTRNWAFPGLGRGSTHLTTTPAFATGSSWPFAPGRWEGMGGFALGPTLPTHQLQAPAQSLLQEEAWAGASGACVALQICLHIMALTCFNGCLSTVSWARKASGVLSPGPQGTWTGLA